MKDTISIIVPIYNAERTLNRCVKSLLEQSFDKIEILLVNDGSKDGSLQLCREWEKADPRIRVIDKPNGGVSSARNMGLEVATGEYVVFCDSDDCVSPYWCEILLQNSAPGDMAVCDMVWPPPERETLQTLSAKIIERNEFMNHPSVMSSVWNKIFQLQIIREKGLRFSEQLRLGEDFVFVMHYLGCITGQVHILPHKLYYYDTSTEGSLSKRSIPMEQCDLFYQQLTEAMKVLNAMDAQSIFNRDLHVMSHFENYLIAVSQDRSLSFGRKLHKAKEVGRLESFQAVNGRVITWENPLFTWLLDKKYTRLLMIYLILRDIKTRL